jgi:ADP-ribose pyrophosphatase
MLTTCLKEQNATKPNWPKGVIYIKDEQLFEKTLSTSYLYRGRIISVRQDTVMTYEGETTYREVVEHPGAVAILAIDDQSRVIMVRQHRQPAEAVMLEIPAGKLELHEDPLTCARREFQEEAAMDAASWEQILTFYPSPGFCDEKIYIFKAEELKPAISPGTDPDENLAVEKIPLEEALKMIDSGQIIDGKTIIALMQYKLKNK